MNIEGSKWHPAGPTHTLIAISDNPFQKLPFSRGLASPCPRAGWRILSPVTNLLSPAEACLLRISFGAHLSLKRRNINEKLLISLQGGLTIVLAKTWDLCVVFPCGLGSFSQHSGKVLPLQSATG